MPSETPASRMISQTMLPEFDMECATTRKVLERVPDDALEWAPHEKSFSMQDLAGHIVNIATWVGSTIEHPGIDMAGGFEPAPTGNSARLLEMFDENVAAARTTLEGADDATLMGNWTLRAGDTEHMTLPRAVVLRNFVLNHMVHHRAQLAVYLRLRDVPVPSIYGPSADEASF